VHHVPSHHEVPPGNGNEYRTGSGRRQAPLQIPLTVDELCRALAGHRYELMTLLALNNPLPVSDLSDGLHLRMQAVSRDLSTLQTCGMVEWMQVKNQHFYRLSERVQASTREGRVQLVLRVPSGDWMFLHREEFSESGSPVLAPSMFFDPRAQQRAPAEELNTTASARYEPAQSEPEHRLQHNEVPRQGRGRPPGTPQSSKR
jgi:DNA-binding transcriptional ArsR family regulator